MNRRVALALFLGAVVATSAEAQVPPTATPATPPVPPTATTAAPGPAATVKPAADDVPPPPPTPAALPATPRPAAAARPSAQSAKPADGRALLAAEGRFANPGGVGRYAEYYTPFTPMTRYQGPPPPHAGFGMGGGPTRGDQLAAFQVGQYRTQNIQNNLNAYGRPVGFGIGIGYGVGFGRGFGGLR